MCVFSPSEGPCCTAECEFASEGLECSEATECKHATNCTGKRTTCPIALHKSDSSTCEDGSKVSFLCQKDCYKVVSHLTHQSP